MTDYDGIGALRTQGLTSGKWIDADDGMTIQVSFEAYIYCSDPLTVLLFFFKFYASKDVF